MTELDEADDSPDDGAIEIDDDETTSPRYARLATFGNAKPGNAVRRLYEGLSRPQCSVLTQLRTGDIGLNAYLFRFDLAPSPNFPHCGVPESVPHFLPSCRAHHPHRLRMIMRLGTARLSLARASWLRNPRQAP
ncbi:hypothetical protein B0H11DRAFT_2250465 [Mycena galericulata]|nr:hypothetical protein B0H11DRAFT_2250465 [Mycena galericulata]